MTRLNFIVEGPTEEAFVRAVMSPYLARYGVYVSVRSIETSRHGAKIYRGGVTTYKKAKADICRWLAQEPDSYLTIMLDYYGLPTGFPCFKDTLGETDIYKKANILESGLSEDIDNKSLIPYIQMHEFESLLFSNTDVIDEAMSLFGGSGKNSALEKITNTFSTPEHINNSRETAPSKRLLKLYPAYDKVFLGSLISGNIGLDQIKKKCLHFSNWIDSLSALGREG